jgi:putative transposase
MVERNDNRTSRTSGMNPWRAGCGESRTSGSEGGPEKPTDRKIDRALRSDPYTYCSTWSGVVYVAFVVDVFSRRIVGWKAARSMAASLVVDALNMAAWTRRGIDLDGLVCHNDAGSQYTSIAYTDRLDDIGAVPSIGTVGDSFDNAMAESVNALYKTELHRNPAVLAANGGHWRGLDDLEIATCGWVGWFNDERIHGELDDLSPAEVEAAYYRHPDQARAA